MDQFLRKHDVDVGKSFSILLFALAIEETYEVFFDLLYQDHLHLNFGILIYVVLACGMYKHSNTSRKWCLGLTWFMAVALIVITIDSSFNSGGSIIRIIVGGKTFENPPLWKLILTDLAFLPAFWIVIRALTSGKAREEFGAAKQAI